MTEPGISLPNFGQDAFNAARLASIVGLAAPEVMVALVEALRTGKLELPGLPPELRDAIVGVIAASEDSIGGPIFDALLGAGLGIADLGAPGSQEEAAVKTVKRAIGFGAALPIAAGLAETPLKALLGSHVGSLIFEAVKDLSNELGVNYFLGLTLERIFETAVSAPLEEAIAERSRPARFDFRQVRALFKAHALSGEEAHVRLQRLGFREQDIPLLEVLDRTYLTIGDLQQAFEFGLRDEVFVRDYLTQLGISGTDLDLVIELYLHRAETAGGNLLRSTAQRGYMDGHLSEGQYRELLTQAHVPPDSIELEIESARLEKSWGHAQLSVAELKLLRLKGHIDDKAAVQKLIEHGYSEDDAMAILGGWLDEQKASKPALTENKVLGFLLGGVITRERAIELLQQAGFTLGDAVFLADHPGAFGGIYAHPLDPKTVVAAVQEQLLDATTARAQLIQLGVDPAEADLQLEIAVHKATRGTKPRQPSKDVTEAQVLEALNLGLGTPVWALRELVTIGYTYDAAMLLVAIEQTKASHQLPDQWVVLS